MVVGVYGFAVVLAGVLVDAVVNEVVTVDDSGLEEPVPYSLTPVDIGFFLFASRDAVGEMGCDGEEELVGDGGDGGVLFVPPDSAAARRRPAACHVFEDVFGGVEVFCVACEVVACYPAEGPPSFVIVPVVYPVVDAVLLGRVLGLFEGVGDDVCGVAFEAGVVGAKFG